MNFSRILLAIIRKPALKNSMEFLTVFSDTRSTSYITQHLMVMETSWYEVVLAPLLKELRTANYDRIILALKEFPYHYKSYITTLFASNPEHVIIETFLIVFVLYVLFVKKSYDPEAKANASVVLRPDEIDQLCEEWTPAPLVEPSAEDDIRTTVVEGTPDAYIKLAGEKSKKLNCATMDFLGFASRAELKDTVTSCLKKYGVGSCGPRGFYGTVDLHKILEKSIASFLKTDDSILYSDVEATISSVIPAFAKRGDLLVIDDECRDAIHIGAGLARSRVLYYKHNDMEDLEGVLKSVMEDDRRAKRSSSCQRRYVVTEGLFRNTGTIVSLPSVIKLCNQYCFRIILDESFSIGVLGDTGRGTTEYHGVCIDDVDIICGSLATSFASVGGFSTGSQLVVDNQRINSAGYVFSASAPPFTSAASLWAVEALDKEPELMTELKSNANYMHDELKKVSGISVVSDRDSALIHCRIKNDSHETLEDVVAVALTKGLAINVMRYRTGQPHMPSFPTIQLTVSTHHTRKHLNQAVSILVDTLKQVLIATDVAVKSTGSRSSKEASLTESSCVSRSRRLSKLASSTSSDF